MSITLTFLIASPLINEVAVVMLGGLFGWYVTLAYVGAGLVLSRFDLDHWVEPFVFQTPVAQLSAGGGSPTLAERVAASREETLDITKKVWPTCWSGSHSGRRSTAGCRTGSSGRIRPPTARWR